MKLFTTIQVKELDKHTIENEPISSIKLMEKAADALFEKFRKVFSLNRPALILAGPGNNGGDGLALARKLHISGINTEIILLSQGHLSQECEINKKRIIDEYPEIAFSELKTFIAPEINCKTIIIDALFGSGLNRPLDKIFSEAVEFINNSGCEVLSIDIPTGLHGELIPEKNSVIVKANYTFSLQFPKLSFLFPETGKFVGDWSVLNIGILPVAIKKTHSNYYLTDRDEIKKLINIRDKFSHKGTYGHTIIYAGSMNMAGAAILAGRAAYRSGAGLVTIHSSSCNRIIVQSSLPEAIFHSDKSESNISEVVGPDIYNSIAIGPGIGLSTETTTFLKSILKLIKIPCILDADAINILSENKDILDILPEYSILTPHPKEFERLFGTYQDSFIRMKAASKIASDKKIIIVLKGAFSQIFLPDGRIYFNNSGNNGMATGGSGDVLTGIIAGLLSQGYPPTEAAIVGVFLHGFAADLALSEQSEESLIAGDICEYLGKAYKKIKSE